MFTNLPRGSKSANTVTYRCFHGGNFEWNRDNVEYVGGLINEGTLDICQLNMKQRDILIQRLGYQVGDVDCFFMFQNDKKIQLLCDDETIEQLRVDGVTYGKVELYLIHSPIDLPATNVSNEILEESVMKSKEGSLIEFKEAYLSEFEKVIDDENEASTDDEFIHVQKKKKDWVSRRNYSGKEQIMRDYEREDIIHVSRGKGQKDSYWGEGEDDGEESEDTNLLLIAEEHQYKERSSDDEGAFSLGDDDEDHDVLDKVELTLYDPTTPFGRVQLELGQLFEKVEVLKRALIYYSCQTRRSFRYCHNEPKRVLVKCKFYPDCRWKLSARYIKDHGCIQIRFFKDIHTCTPTKINKRLSADFLAEEYQEKLLKHPTWKLKLFVQDVEETYGVTIDRWQAGRAKKNALSACGKVVGRQYDSLRAYMSELKRSNVGTTVFLSLKSSIPGCIPQFHMIYINFAAIRHNFLQGCRRVLGLDGAFLKGYCKGEILCAVARDANNQMFPVAWAVVEIESKESWSWFLGHLIQDLEIGNGNGWTLLSDQQKGLMVVIAEMLPEAEHRLCARHIFTNWIKVIKGVPLHTLYWKAVKAYTEKEFNDIMEQLRQQSERAYTEMCARDVTKFCRCFYKTWASIDVTCNNMAKTFNSWILEAREKPILSMLEETRRQVMSWMVKKRAEATKCNRITSRIRAKLNDFRQATKNWVPIEASTNVYEVQHTHNSALSYTVRLDQKVCACKYWDLNGVPCEHATSTICALNQDPESYVAFWYTKETYEASYSFSLEPLNGQALWETVEEGSILPSDPRIKCGKPPNKRKKAYGDVRQKRLKYRVPKSGKQVCSTCQQIGHNRRTCPSKST